LTAKTTEKAEEGYVQAAISDKDVDALRAELEAAKAQLRLIGEKPVTPPDEGEKVIIGWVKLPPTPGIQRKKIYVEKLRDSELYLRDFLRKCSVRGFRERGYTIYEPGDTAPELENWPSKPEALPAGVPGDGSR